MPSLVPFTRHFERGSAAIDWCESNYVITQSIAEFANTMTCFYFVFFPPLLMYLFRPYGRFVTNGIHMVWGLLIIVGITSAYFHATLSMMGQILDELSILWVLLAGTSLWFPKKLLPNLFQTNRKLFLQSLVAVGVLGTVLACIQPAFNSIALMIFGVPAAYLLLAKIRRSSNPRAVRLGKRCAFTWIIAIICWLNDRLLCDMWSIFNFQYFHAIWHILIFSASYPACALFAYFHARREVPEKQPSLQYWPLDSFEYGVPYVAFIDLKEN